MAIELTVDGVSIVVEDERADLLTVLREQCGITSVKDGCAPQGQCGCCTVLIDGQARVSCVTPVRRIAGRNVVTLDGLDPDARERWAAAFASVGASQCGFCTPGIICRFSALEADGVGATDVSRIDNALAAHLCRCTGWQTITEAYVAFGAKDGTSEPTPDVSTEASERRAELEGGVSQRVGPAVARGQGGFSADTAPNGALVAVPDTAGGWVVANSLAEARAASGKVQGRRTTAATAHPLAVPVGDWAVTLQTGWVEPAALETETVWCEPGGDPSSLVANGGAFGAKEDLQEALGSTARRLADEHGCAVRVVLSREDSVRMGSKRPPIAAGVRTDGSGELVVARTPGIADSIRSVAPELTVTEVDLSGPPTSTSIRGAGWVEAAVLVAVATGSNNITSPGGGSASATIDADGIHVRVGAGIALDAVVLRSYCIGAAHMAWSWVTSEQLTVAEDGTVGDLTIRSFGIVRSADMPHVSVTIDASDQPSVNGSDAVLAAVALAAWRAGGFPSAWPMGLPTPGN